MSEIYFIEHYKDLLTQIEIHENIIEINMQSIKYYQKQMFANTPHDISAISLDGMPSGNNSPISLDRAISAIRKCEHIVEIETDILEKLRQTKKDLDEKIHALQGIYFQVAVKKHIEGKTLQIIADELGYSLDYIQHISASIK